MEVLIHAEYLAAVIRKARKHRPEDSLLAYLVCEIADLLPVNERAAWHDLCASVPDRV